MSWGVATQNGVSVSLASIVSLSCGATEAFTPASLFTSGAKGAWYDPSDYTSLFQDSAGATPVTAVEQSVRLMRDKSGNANDATSPSDASRPVLRARYNLLTYSEDFSNVLWVKFSCTASAMNIADPIGGNTASTVTSTAAPAYFYYNSGILSPTTPTISRVWLRRRTGTGIVGLRNNANTGTYTTLTLTSSWQLFSVVCTTGVFNANRFVINLETAGDAIDVWHPDLRLNSDPASLPNYQQITTATSYDTVGFLPYLALDGSDDSMATGSIDFSATDKMFACAGISKTSDSVDGMLVELSSSVNSNTGSFYVQAPEISVSATRYSVSGRGAAASAANQRAGTTSATYAATITNVLTGIFDISGDSNNLRLNATSIATATGDQGTGNYGNYPLYIGRRNNASLPFNGRIYQMVVCGKALSASELASTEAFVNTKTGAY
jgi:hypothetical protein